MYSTKTGKSLSNSNANLVDSIDVNFVANVERKAPTFTVLCLSEMLGIRHHSNVSKNIENCFRSIV